MAPYVPPAMREAPSTPSYRPPKSSQWSSNGRGGGRAGDSGSIRSDGLKMARKEIGRKPGEMEMLASPSRGIDGNDEASLRNFQVQERFREHIRAKIVKLDSIYPAGKNDCWPKRKEELSIILLDFRKLREGLTSSKRVDSFAAEVYESSVNYAIEAENWQQMGTSLPHLVFELHPLLTSRSLATTDATQNEEDLADSLAKVSLSSISAYDLDTNRVALYQSLYLLHLVVQLNEITTFHFHLATFSDTSPSSPPTLHPHLLFAQKVNTALLSSNYITFSRLLSPSFSPLPHPLQIRLLKSYVPHIREKIWSTIAKAYKMESDFKNLKWLRNLLCFEGDEEGKRELIEYMTSKGKKVEVPSAWD